MSAINDVGHAVGTAFGGSGGVRAILTDGTATTDLNSVLDPITGGGVTAMSGLCINNMGQIGGAAVNSNGETVGMILTPMSGVQGASMPTPRKPGPRATDLAPLREFLRDSKGVTPRF